LRFIYTNKITTTKKKTHKNATFIFHGFNENNGWFNVVPRKQEKASLMGLITFGTMELNTSSCED
jgi:hypothetical protein